MTPTEEPIPFLIADPEQRTRIGEVLANLRHAVAGLHVARLYAASNREENAVERAWATTSEVLEQLGQTFMEREGDGDD